jgi:hypothetical protein
MEAAGDSSSGGHRVREGDVDHAKTTASDTTAVIDEAPVADITLEPVTDKTVDIFIEDATDTVHDTDTASDAALQAAIDTILHGEDTTTPHGESFIVSDESKDEAGDALSANHATETDPLNPEGEQDKFSEEVVPALSNGNHISSNGDKMGKIYLLYLSRALTAWGDRLWSFGLGMFLFRIQPESLLLMAGYGLAKSLTSILLDAAIGAWIDRTGRLRLVKGIA